MDFQTIMAVVAVVSLLLNLGGLIAAATWGVAKVRLAVSDEMGKHRGEFDEKIMAQERNAGEAISAIRSKVHEFEMWSRDTFVRRDSFLAVVTKVEAGISELGKQIDRRLERIENRLYGNPGGSGT